jgi:hypothetical protein
MNNIKGDFIICLIIAHIIMTMIIGIILLGKADNILQSAIDRDDKLMSACGYVLGNE